MVPLDEVSSADQVVSSIASSLGVPESPGQSLLDLVINYLRPRKMLLLLDNFEHVVAAAGVLGQFITETDQVMLLVTSRERLRLSGERVVEVPPLQVPDVADGADVLRRSDAVELFIDRARAAGSDLSLDHDQLETIAEICDGSMGARWPLSLPGWMKVVGRKSPSPPGRRLSFLTAGADLP
jgi:predicted ATPase